METMTTTYARYAMKIALAACLLNLCVAQTTNFSWLRFNVSRVKPEMAQEFEGYLKQIGAAYKKSGAPFFIVYQNFAGDQTEYTSVLFVSKFADLDGPNPIAKTLGAEGYANLLRSLRRCTVSTTRYYSLIMDGLDIVKGPPGEYLMLTRTQIVPGKMPDYEAWLKSDYKPALEKAGVTFYRSSRPIFGAPGNTVEAVRGMKNLAEIDGGPILTQALGADAVRAMNAKVNDLIRTSSITIIQIRADLSVLPPVPGSN
jgi:hypothetical protein